MGGNKDRTTKIISDLIREMGKVSLGREKEVIQKVKGKKNSRIQVTL